MKLKSLKELENEYNYIKKDPTNRFVISAPVLQQLAIIKRLDKLKMYSNKNTFAFNDKLSKLIAELKGDEER
jgi:hypothetical protein